jgi:hypothetical protein
MKIEEVFNRESQSDIIAELKSKRYIEQPDESDSIKGLDPKKHDVFNKALRPDKKVKIDTDNDSPDAKTVVTSENGNPESGFRYEPVARIALALQKLIVKRAVAFIFGNKVGLNAETENDNQLAVLKAVKRVLYDVKEKSLNRKVARQVFSCTECAELWYPVEKLNTTYGFPSKFKLRCAVFSPLLGDTLYPYFDESGDMVAFSREFSRVDNNKVKHDYFETYTDKAHFMWTLGGTGYELVEGYPKEIAIGKIPVVFGNQEQVEWSDVQILIDRLEKLLSNFADTNDYHAAPKIFVQGEVKGFSKKGESGAILEGEEGATAQYLSWQNAPESVKLEIETLLRMIHTISQTPDISFDSVKGLGAISGVALKLLFMDAHLKVADHQEVFDEYLQRRINVIKAYIGKFNTKLESDAESIQIEPEIIPYMIEDELTDITKWTTANGGKPVVSQKLSSKLAGLSKDPDADFEQMQSESDRANQFSFNEPTIV